MAASAASIFNPNSQSTNKPHPFLQIVAANESRQSPIRIKRSAVICLRPGGFAAPEERWCRFASNELCTDSWLSHSDANPLLARVAGDPFCCSGDGERHLIQVQIKFAPRSQRGSAHHLDSFALILQMKKLYENKRHALSPRRVRRG